MARKLTKKQKLFVEFYFQTWNATQAAREAGYKGSNQTLRAVGYENLTKPHIQAEIESRLSDVVMGSNEVLARLADMARAFDMTQYVELKETYDIHEKDGKHYRAFAGYAVWFDLEKLQKDGFSHLVKKIKQNAHGGIEIEWHDQMAALIHVGKHHKLFTDKLDIQQEGNITVIGVGVDTDKL